MESELKVIEGRKGKLILKNVEIEMLGNSAALSVLINDKNVPASTTFKLAVFMKRFLPVITAFQETKQKLITKYCDRDKDGNPIQQGNQYVFTEHKDKFFEEYQELLNGETEMDCEKIKINVDQLPNGLLSANDMLQLFSVIDFVEG